MRNADMYEVPGWKLIEMREKITELTKQAERLNQKLAALLAFSESGRIAGHQLSDSERDALYEEARALLTQGTGETHE